MGPKAEFEFLNSQVWIDYTQKRYLTPDEIRHRTAKNGNTSEPWKDLELKIVRARKTASVPLFVNSLDKKFWFFISDSLIRKLTEIERLGLVLSSRIRNQPSFSQDFYRDSMVEEAVTSAIYEGANSTRAKAKQLLESESKPFSKDDWMLINNYHALQWVDENKREPISIELILTLHALVTSNTLEGDDANFSGKFRNEPVFIGAHEGADHGRVEEALNEVLQLIDSNQRYIHPLIQSILIHYFTAYIHPFFDGNGRTARAMFYFKSIQSDLGYIQLLSVSAYLKEHGQQYEKSFDKVVNNELDITYFIDFCLDSIHSAFSAVSKKVDYLLSLGGLERSLGFSQSQIGLLQRMALQKFRTVSIEQYALQIGRSREVARKELKTLLNRKILFEHKQGKKFVYRINKQVLDSHLDEVHR